MFEILNCSKSEMRAEALVRTGRGDPERLAAALGAFAFPSPAQPRGEQVRRRQFFFRRNSPQEIRRFAGLR